ncbi:hypothetical protein [Devosia sp.]|uniref:hypothetical protein n=1 Tax=Devosia sp. TaxID=1871048 RepID=UPI003A942BBD
MNVSKITEFCLINRYNGGQLRVKAMQFVPGISEVNEFISALRSQVELAFSVSALAFGAIVFAWARLFGVIASKDMRGFSAAGALAVPMILLLIAMSAGYVIVAAMSGFRYELVTGVNASNLEKIDDEVSHFELEYLELLQLLGWVQLLCSATAIIFVSAWYAWNALKNKAAEKRKEA